MTNKIKKAIISGGVGLALLASSPMMVLADNPVPVISNISPSSANQGSGAITLTVNGVDFLSTSVVYFNGAPKPTFFASSTQLTATISAGDLSASGNYNVNVLNSSPGGGFSNTVVFTVTSASNAVPTISNISPTTKVAGEAGFTLTVNGTGFMSGSVVRLDGSPRTTTLVSSTQLQASISSADIAAAGNKSITVANPTPGGGTSNAVTLAVSSPAPVPTITSMSPTQVTPGSSSFNLTVNGTNFVSSGSPSIVRVNGSDRVTTFVSSTQLTALIPASDVAASGTRSITVFNAGPNNQGTSNTMTLTVSGGGATGPAVISSISPSSRVAGSGAFTLFVNGSNFDSTIRFNGIAMATTKLSPTQLSAVIPASAITTPGQYVVAVQNDNGTMSNPVIFTATAVPGLPDTGFGPQDDAKSAMMLLLIGLGAAASLPLVRKMIKHPYAK